MKAIIPVASSGTRLRPLTYTQPKPLIPVAGKPILSFILDPLLRRGITEFLFLLGYLGDKIRAYVEEDYPKLNATFVAQDEGLGLGHALWKSRDFLAGEREVVIAFGDAIVDIDLAAFLKHPHSCVAISRVSDPWEYGVVELGIDQQVVRMVEKPAIPLSDKALVGLYRIADVPAMLDALSVLVPRSEANGEPIALIDTFKQMLSAGVPFGAMEVDNWFNCARREVLLETNAIFLDREGYASVDLPPYDNTIIIHPVSIGRKCKIRDSILGPYVTVGDHVEVNHAILSDSIIGNYSKLDSIILKRSVVGNDVSLSSAGLELNIGDHTAIDFGHP